MTHMMMPWAPHSRCYCSPKRLMFTLALGEDARQIPGRMSVRVRSDAPGAKTGHGAVDRVLSAYGGNVALTRLHDPADAQAGFDLTEHALGLSRTYVADFSDHHRIDQTADALRQLAVVTSVSADYFVSTAQTLDVAAAADPTWPWEMIGAETARREEPGDPAITAAVLDTGAAKRHVEIAGRLSSGFDAVNFSRSELSQGMSLIGDYGTRDVDPDEQNNPHGTACLALIGGIGRAMPAGLAETTTMMPVRVLASAEAPAKSSERRIVGLGALSDIDYAVKRSVDLGAKVLNCSFGTAEAVLQPDDPKPHADTTAYALDRGTIMVAASGNSGKTERFYPAAMDGVIAVGSVGATGAQSAFSTKGEHVALSAPGEAILTPSITDYEYSTGTSFAAPFVAGAAALLVSRARKAARPLDSRQARDILVESTRPFERDTSGGGAGILNIPAALAALDRELATATTLTAVA